MYIEESFDTIFNMDYGSGKSPTGERVKPSCRCPTPLYSISLIPSYGVICIILLALLKKFIKYMLQEVRTGTENLI